MQEATAEALKVCASCGKSFPVDALFCPTDGMPLQSAAAIEREPADPYLGQEISGHIVIRQVIGVGAMGRVYRAFQRGIDRDVAVKILHRELSANAQLVARFTREAKVASRLQHPNVVSVLLAGQLPDRALYMVMEYLDGLSLQSALAGAGGALPLTRAMHIALQLCEAAGEAHAQGIVHRDLKPENVMLVRRGGDHDFVKVLDFGIARINWGEQSVATAAGLIFGTARYISPEGAQGLAVTPASDVYAIATLLYQMLSGRTPFDGDQAVGLLVQQIHDPAPSLRSLPRAQHVPQPIADVVMAALVKDPLKREVDARALGEALFEAAKASGLSPDELARPHKKSISRISMPPVEPELLKPAANGKPTAATVKWEPPSEFQARLQDATRARDSSIPDASGSHPRLERKSVDETLDDYDRGKTEYSSAPTPSFPKTVPGDMPVRTQYETPAPPEPTPTGPRQPSYRSSYPDMREVEDDPGQDAREGIRSRWLVVVACFVLGALLALGYAYSSGRLGSDAEEADYVARATDAMFKNHFAEPPGENVKEITDEGLRRWPRDRKLLDVRHRAAGALTTQAIALRSAGDVLEALRLARLAHDLDPADTSVKRLVEQYESELATFSPSAAPTLTPPPSARPGVAPPVPGGSVQAARIDYKALVDVSIAAPRVGQNVELTARIAPNKGEFADPGFTVVGPGVPNGVRLPAAATAPGVYKTTYVFLEGGKFDVAFSTQVEGKSINAKRIVTTATPPAPGPMPGPAPAPAPPPAPAPAPPAGSVKWM